MSVKYITNVKHAPGVGTTAFSGGGDGRIPSYTSLEIWLHQGTHVSHNSASCIYLDNILKFTSVVKRKI